MENNPEETLNTESNDIAGNRIDGPVGNTAAQHTLTKAPVGVPGGAPSAAPDTSSPGVPVSSESLAASETSVGKGAVDGDTKPQENKEANPDDLQPTDKYGGNFGNSTQDSYRDEDRRENQDSDPNRGEFGAQDPGGTTHGGFGNQNRVADYEPRGSAEDRYYGGPGAPGQQDNAYRAYDGRDERPDSRTEYGFEPGTAVDRRPASVGIDPNDNGSLKGPGSGYAADYGNTSLQTTPMADHQPHPGAAGPERRNQTEDYMPTQGDANAPNTSSAPINPEASGQRPASSEGYGDLGREEPRRAPDFQTGDDRNGYVASSQGDAEQGIGSRGGSYNDAYDDSKPNSNAGSPAKGDERQEDRARNYGNAAREENRAGDENAADHGAPQRNAGRDGEADE
jgi:hypothetical protein